MQISEPTAPPAAQAACLGNTNIILEEANINNDNTSIVALPISVNDKDAEFVAFPTNNSHNDVYRRACIGDNIGQVYTKIT